MKTDLLIQEPLTQENVMPQTNAYLIFDGTCAEAMRFYEKTLGGKLEYMSTFGEGPGCEDMPAEIQGRIMHARLNLDGQPLMASDSMPGHPYQGMSGFSLALAYPTAEEAERVFNLLAEGGKVTMPLNKTFWADSFGMLVDRFGTPWMVNGNLQPM